MGYEKMEMSQQAPARRRRQPPIREFLAFGSIAIVTATLVLSSVIGLFLLRSQISVTATLIRQRIENSISTNRDEILNEIALNDMPALKEHLRILRSDMDLDSIALRYRSVEIISESREDKRWGFVGFLVPEGNLRPVTIQLSSDYGGFEAQLVVSYRDEVIRQVTHRVLVPFLVTMAALLLVEFLSFLAVFFLIDSWIIRPIQDLAASFKPAAVTAGDLQQSPRRPSLGIRINELENLKESLFAYNSLRESALANEISQQVAHDIRSPLAALDSATKDVSQLPEDKRIIIRSSVARIRDIANQLIDKTRASRAGGNGRLNGAGVPETEKCSAELLSSLMDPLISEKRMQFRSRLGIEIEGRLDVSSYGLFAKIQPGEFKRVLSNLIDNSVEAMGEKGFVSVSMSSLDGEILIKVQDNGKGIPPGILPKLGQRGETYGKAGGSGLGLYHARTLVEQWGGALTIDSEEHKGTTISIRIPMAEPLGYFAQELCLSAGAAVLVLDDDAAIHQVWDGRFESARVKEHGVEIIHFSEPDRLRKWVVENAASAAKSVCLFDYELLGYRETGLSLAKELGLCGRTLLVTSRSEEKRIIEECSHLGIGLIPKGLAGLVPIRFENAFSDGVGDARKRAVLLDDDSLVRMSWRKAAESVGVDLKVFNDSRSFLSNIDAYSKSTSIYLDSELGEGGKGEDIALTLREKGFTDITLETGYEPVKFAHLPWLKVMGKESPWRA